MMFANRNNTMSKTFPARQRGALTMFSAVLILILLTGMVIYAAQVGVFEQRKSGNELRQKQAFHAAEVGIQTGQEFLLANIYDMTSQDGETGWLSDELLGSGGSGRWIPCLGRDESNSPYSQWHPCWGESLDDGDPVNLRKDTFFYSENGVDPTPLPLPIEDGQDLIDRTTEAAEVYALLCMLDVQPNFEQPVRGCLGGADRSKFDQVYFAVTLLARGYSECDANGCRGEALVAQRLGSHGPIIGDSGPGVPLTSKTSLHPSGTVEIVANPNGGGVGVPVSVWIDGKLAVDPVDGVEKYMSICYPGEEAVQRGSNSWATCEMHEWYGQDFVPEDLACPTTTCDCAPSEQMVSYGNKGNIRYDIVIDPGFPCELFTHMFKTTSMTEAIGRFTVIDDCSDLGPDSYGPIWVNTDKCALGSGSVKQIGSHKKPVFLVASANELSLGGGVLVYGVVMVTDIDEKDALFDASGGGTVIGAVIIDGELEPNYGSNFEIVWNDELVRLATKLGSMGNMYGGWTDIHEDWR